jgi:hypothetical protein
MLLPKSILVVGNAGARANAATKRAVVEELAEREHSQMTEEEIVFFGKVGDCTRAKESSIHEIMGTCSGSCLVIVCALSLYR